MASFQDNYIPAKIKTKKKNSITCETNIPHCPNSSKQNLKIEERNKIDTPNTHIPGDGHLSEKINLHCGHLRDNISGHLSDTI